MKGFCEDWDFDLDESLFHQKDSFLDSGCCFDPFLNIPVPSFYHESNPSELPIEGRHFKSIEPTLLMEESSEKPIIEFHETKEVISPEEPKKASKTKKRKNPKPSPYHNFQKHLNSTMKQILCLPLPSESSPNHHHVALRLWNTFKLSDLSTKKSLHFIFNEFNEYTISQEELRHLGFTDIYEQNSREELSKAKNLLTELAIEQLSLDNIDDYLQTRRIKNPLKFKKYLLQFRQELQDRFIKKRFTNRSRKQQIQKMLKQSQQI